MLWTSAHTNNFLDKIRACANCGAFGKFTSESRILCEKCKLSLDNSKIHGPVSDYDFKTISLYRWDNSNSTLVSRIARALKGGGPKQVYAEFASQLLQLQMNRSTESCLLNDNKKEIIFVPAPGRKSQNEKLDHAEQLAMCIAGEFGGVSLGLLERTTNQQSKNMSLEERAKPSIELSAGALSDLSRVHSAQIVFVDDIITTGGTAVSAYKALQRPPYFEIWTIFHRPLLRC
jgi:predicted amidophosphoribosyltransferase